MVSTSNGRNSDGTDEEHFEKLLQTTNMDLNSTLNIEGYFSSTMINASGDKNQNKSTPSSPAECSEFETEQEDIHKVSKASASEESEFDSYGITLIICGCMLRFLTLGTITSVGVVMRILIEQFNTGKGETNWIGSVNTGVMMLVGPVAGALESKLDSRKLILMGSVIATFGVGACAFVPDIPYFYFTYGVIYGIGNSLTLLAAIIPINMYFKKQRTLANAIATVGSGVGTTVVPHIITAVEKKYAWRGLFLILAGLQLNAAVFGMLTRPTYKLIQSDTSRKLQHRRKSSIVEDSRDLFQNKYFLMYGLAGVLNNGVLNIPFFLLPIKASESGLVPSAQAMVIMVVGITSTVSRPILGVIFDNMQQYTMLFQGVSIVCLGCGTLWLSSIETEVLFYAYGVILGLTHGSYILLQPLALLDVVEEHRYAMGLGYFRLLICAGVMTGAPIAGWLVDVRGTYDWACYFCAVVGLIGGVIIMVENILMVIQTKKRKKEGQEICVPINRIEKTL